MPDSVQGPQRADIETKAIGFNNDFSDGCCITEAKIEALAGNRMDAVCSVTYERKAWFHEFTRQCQAERECTAWPFDSECAKAMAEALFKLGFKMKSSSRINRSASAVRSVQTSELRLPGSGESRTDRQAGNVHQRDHHADVHGRRCKRCRTDHSPS